MTAVHALLAPTNWNYSLLERPTNLCPGYVYQRSRTGYVDKFYRALRKWKSETAYLSDPIAITAHPSYLSIVALGQNAVELICDDLDDGPSLLVYALEDITGDAPYADEDEGDISAMTQAWLQYCSDR